MEALQNTPIPKEAMPKPKVYKDTLALVLLLDEVQEYYPHKYKYGWGNDIQHIAKDLFKCIHASQKLPDFNRRVQFLDMFIVNFDTLYTLLEIITYKCALPENKLNMIYRTMDEIAKQIKGLRSYFAKAAGQNRGQ